MFTTGLALMAAAAMVSGLILLLNTNIHTDFPQLYLLPWILGLAIVFFLPSLIFFYQGKFTFYNPIVFATWTYFFPAFVIGGFMLTIGWSQPYYLSFIQDAEYNLPYTVALIALGFVSLYAGFILPVGRIVGSAVESRLPGHDHNESSLIIPGIVLMSLGLFTWAFAFILGLVGFQSRGFFEAYDGLIFLTTLFGIQGSFMLWLVVFRERRIDLRIGLVIVVLLVATAGKAAFAGNRGSLYGAFMVAALAFFMTHRRLNLRQMFIAGFGLVACITAGMIYGTTFREVRGTQSHEGAGQYTASVFDTLERVGSDDPIRTLETGIYSLAERIDTLSSAAVIVSNYEQFQAYEESYGLDNNIWKDTWTLFIPRLMWPDKPYASDPRKLGALYFGFDENSFAITPVADLLRNFGVAGVAVGMLLFGMVLRVIYRLLIENQPRLIWRSVLYFMLLTSISYEGFFGSILPYMMKVGITAILGILLVQFVSRFLGARAGGQSALGRIERSVAIQRLPRAPLS